MNNERSWFAHDLSRRPPEGSQFATPESPQPRSLENARLLTGSKDHQCEPMNQSTGRTTGFQRGPAPQSTGQSSFIQLPQASTIPGMFPVQLAGHPMPDGASLHHDAQAALQGMYAAYVQPPPQHQQPLIPLGYPQFPVYGQPQAYLSHGPQGALSANMVMPMAYTGRDSMSGRLQNHWGNELYPIAPSSFAPTSQLPPVGPAAGGYNPTGLPVAGLPPVPVAMAPSNFPASRSLKDHELVMLPPPAVAPNRSRLVASTTDSTGGKPTEKKRHRQSRKSRKANSVGSGDEEEEREGNGEARLLIIFDNTGELDLQHPPRVGKKGFVPNGLAGTFSMYSERWTFKVEYGDLAQGEDGQQRYCIKWSIKNAAWDDFISILETPREALRRETRGFTLCNKVFREAMQKRAEEYEELAKKERANPKPNINQLNNFETRASYLRPQKVSEGPLLFGLRHKAVQDSYKQALSKDSDAVAVSSRARSTPEDNEALNEKSNVAESGNGNREKTETFDNDQSDSEGSSSSSSAEEETAA